MHFEEGVMRTAASWDSQSLTVNPRYYREANWCTVWPYRGENGARLDDTTFARPRLFKLDCLQAFGAIHLANLCVAKNLNLPAPSPAKGILADLISRNVRAFLDD
jgi:hypothetical protein